MSILSLAVISRGGFFRVCKFYKKNDTIPFLFAFVSVIMNNYNAMKTNPDPVIAQVANSTKDINYLEVEDDFRLEHQAILESYLSNQGI